VELGTTFPQRDARADPPPRAVAAGGSTALAHRNNFDFLRWLAATFVLVSHEYAVLGRGGDEPILGPTGGFTTLGTLGVDLFFVMSGCLVTASMARGTGVPFFVASRALRILPGLFVALVVSTLAVGLVATTLPLADYLRDGRTWRYVWHGVTMYDLQWTLPGAFERLPFAGVVNGSLWSLWPEVQMYAAVVVLGALASLVGASRRVVLLFGMTVIAVIAWTSHADLAGKLLEGPTLARLALFFAFGAILEMLGWRGQRAWLICTVAIACAVVARHSPLFVPAFDLAVALCVVAFAYAPLPLHNWARFGDWSYGMYVYAFPVQQIMTLYGPRLPLPLHFALAYAITVLLAALSWRLVEAPALRLKALLRTAPPVSALQVPQPRG
jgi:peptidoglycan/LPS O-acetylase OafA/YrhL